MKITNVRIESVLCEEGIEVTAAGLMEDGAVVNFRLTTAYHNKQIEKIAAVLAEVANDLEGKEVSYISHQGKIVSHRN